MRHFSTLLLFCCMAIGNAQVITEMTPKGFPPVEFPTPAKPQDKLLQLTKSWAATYNKKTFDVFDVTENSITVEALKENACFYYNLGVQYKYNIRYTLKIDFLKENKYRLTFSANEFYADENLTKTTVADFFTPEGKLKEDFEEVKPSLEITASKIIRSYADFIAR